MVDLGFMKLPCAGDFSVFKLLFGMACACVSIATVFASTPLVGPALATSLEASRGGVDLQPLVDALRPAVHVFGHSHFGWDMTLDGVRYLQAPLVPPRRLEALAACRTPANL